MPYVQSSGARIYYKVEGTGPPIVMTHGYSDSLVDWYEAGYVDALRDDYQLVMIDCRGHGLSDKPRAQEAYTMEMRVADVHAVMDESRGRRRPLLGLLDGWSNRVRYIGEYSGAHIEHGHGRDRPARIEDQTIPKPNRIPLERDGALSGRI